MDMAAQAEPVVCLLHPHNSTVATVVGEARAGKKQQSGVSGSTCGKTAGGSESAKCDLQRRASTHVAAHLHVIEIAT